MRSSFAAAFGAISTVGAALGEHVFHGTRRDGIAPRLEAVARERVAAVGVAHDRDGLVRPFALQADEHAFHRAFGGQGDAARQRGGRLRAGEGRCGECEESRQRLVNECADAHESPEKPP